MEVNKNSENTTLWCHLALAPGQQLLAERLSEQRLVHSAAPTPGPVGVILAGLGPPIALVEQASSARLIFGREF